jgi:hypothetical protein
MICTTHCVGCGSPADGGYTGHVHDPSSLGSTITSGWCKKCVSKGIQFTHTGIVPFHADCTGCDGLWKPNMGIEVRE